MKQLVIIGAGGFARDVYNFALNSKGYNKEFIIKGFLDKDTNAMDCFKGYPPVLGYEGDYTIGSEDVFITAIGDNLIRKKVVDAIEAKGGKFISLIHNTAVVHTNANIGIGCLIQPMAFVGADTIIGNHTYIQNNTVIGHDVHIGSYCRIDCNVVFVGGTTAEDNVTVHTNSVINHKVKVFSDSVVGACSFVIRNVKQGSTVVGNPAKRLME